jgi:NhaP-type Na+/H+ or K+/H+ antiporter
MFEDGYNFPKRKFFQNILYINLFGFIGTILNFVCIWGVLYLFNYYCNS